MLVVRPAAAVVVAAGNPAGRSRRHKAPPVTRRLSCGVEVEVYGMDRPEGRCCAASAFWQDQELLRVDLIPGDPHVHYGLAQVRMLGAGRSLVAMPDATDDALLDRAAFELRHNLGYCLQTHPSRKVAGLVLDPGELDEMATWARAELARLQAGPAE